jgi:hypothetical protein
MPSFVGIIGTGFGLIPGHLLDRWRVLGIDGRFDRLATGVDQFTDDNLDFTPVEIECWNFLIITDGG